MLTWANIDLLRRGNLERGHAAVSSVALMRLSSGNITSIYAVDALER